MKKDYRGLRGIQQGESDGRTFGYSTVSFEVDNPDIVREQFIYISPWTKIAQEYHEYLSWVNEQNLNLLQLRKGQDWSIGPIIRKDISLTEHVKDI